MAGAAGPGGIQLFGPAGELGRLAAAQAQLADLQRNLDSGFYTGNDDDSIVVLKISAIYFKSSIDLLALTTGLMDELDASEVTEANKLAAGFEAAVLALEQGCRAGSRDAAVQKEACAKAYAQLSQYLALAARHYTVPSVRIS